MIERAANGEPFIIAKAGKPMVTVTALSAPTGGVSRLGFMTGQIEDPGNILIFSVASLWEIAIKRGLGRDDFRVDTRLLRRGLIDNGYAELAITSEHVVAVDSLPPLHRDSFDRLLIAQATAEGVTLLTSDKALAAYLGPIRAV
jgi:PIN domain nuclease of toxin-antitoxin system